MCRSAQSLCDVYEGDLMYCPDCRGQVELVEVRQMVMGKDDLAALCEEHYFKCPKCREEFSTEDLEE